MDGSLVLGEPLAREEGEPVLAGFGDAGDLTPRKETLRAVATLSGLAMGAFLHARCSDQVRAKRVYGHVALGLGGMLVEGLVDRSGAPCERASAVRQLATLQYGE